MDTRGTNHQLNSLLNAILFISTFASFVCCVYLLSRPIKNMLNRGKRIVFCLCLSDFIGNLFWAVNNYTQYGCPYVGALNLFGYNASAMWTCAIGMIIIYMITLLCIITILHNDGYSHFLLFRNPCMISANIDIWHLLIKPTVFSSF
jgi:hypothetical protein